MPETATARFSAAVSSTQLRNLKGTGDAKLRDTAGRVLADVGSVEQDGPTVGFEIAGDHVDERGFSGAVGADQAEPLAGRNIEGERVGCNHRAEALLKPAYRKNRVHGVAPRSAVRGAVVEMRRLRPFLIQSEPIPRGRNRMTPRRKTPSTSCQVLGK